MQWDFVAFGVIAALLGGFWLLLRGQRALLEAAVANHAETLRAVVDAQTAQQARLMAHLEEMRVVGGEPKAIADKRMNLQAEQIKVLAEKQAALDALRRQGAKPPMTLGDLSR